MDAMRVIEIEGPGGPEVLRPAERPVPSPGQGEALIHVAAAGVNRPDVLQRMGTDLQRASTDEVVEAAHESGLIR